MIKTVFTSMILTGALVAAKVYTVDQLVETALVSSPDINISKAAYSISQQRYEQARSGYLPVVNLEGGGGVTGIDNGTIDEDGSLVTGQLTASQLLYDFGKTSGASGYAEKSMHALHADYQQKIANKIFDVKQAYYRVLDASHQIYVRQEDVKLSEQQLYRAKRYYEAGIKTKIDISDARVKLTQAKLNLNTANYDLKLAYITLNQSVGISTNEQIEAVYRPDLDLTDVSASMPTFDESLESLEQFAYQNRQELKVYQQSIEASREKLEGIRGDYYPTITADASYLMNETDDTLEAYVPKSQWQGLVMVRWNLFSGFKTDAQTQEASIEVSQKQSELANARLKIKEEVSNAYITLLKNRDRVQLSQDVASATKEKFTQAQKRYENSLSDYIELQQARQEYIDSLSSLISAYYDLHIAKASLDRAVGR
jgi:outer membrane protein